MVAIYYSVCHFWAQRILIYKHIENALKQVLSTCLGSELKVRTIILPYIHHSLTVDWLKGSKTTERDIWNSAEISSFQSFLTLLASSLVNSGKQPSNIMVLTFSPEPKQVLVTCFEAFSKCLYTNILWAQKWQTE